MKFLILATTVCAYAVSALEFKLIDHAQLNFTELSGNRTLQCMQGSEYPDEAFEGQIGQCDTMDAMKSVVRLFSMFPKAFREVMFTTGDYKCYHVVQKGKSGKTIFKGCTYKSLNICGRSDSDSSGVTFCSACEVDGCNSGGRVEIGWTLLGLMVLVSSMLKLLK